MWPPAPFYVASPLRMAWPKVRTVYGSIWPFVWLYKMLGALNYTLVWNVDQSQVIEIRKTLTDVVGNILNFIVLVYVGYFLQFKLGTGSTFALSSAVLQRSEVTVLKIGLAIVLAVKVITVVNGAKTVRTFEGFHQFDSIMKTISQSMNHQKENKIIVTAMAAIVATFIASTALTSYIWSRIAVIGAWPPYHLLIAFCLVNVSYTLLMGFYILLTLLTYVRYMQVNRCFRESFPVVQSQAEGVTLSVIITENVMGARAAVIVDRLAKLYNMLTELLDTINACLSFAILITVGALLSFAVVTLFSLYQVMTTAAAAFNDNNLMRSLNNLYWLLYYTFFLMVVLVFGSRTGREAKHTAVLIHKALNNMADDRSTQMLKRKLRLFSMQIQNRLPMLRCGLFPLDWTLLYSIGGTVTTYLIILIQLDSLTTATKGDGATQWRNESEMSASQRI